MHKLNIMDFGACPDTLSTTAIQNAIVACHDAGGGIVIIPAGRFITGTIELLDNVTLQLEENSVLEASPCPENYRKAYPEVKETLLLDTYDSPFNMDQNLIFARNRRNVGITGKGRIFANGSCFYQTEQLRNTAKNKPDFTEYRLKEWRPGPTLAFMDCENVILQDFTLLDNPMFAIAIMHCHHVDMSKITINTCQNFVNGDGIHVKSSTHIAISDCIIHSEDDALCFYNDNWCWHSERNSTEDCTDIYVNNCLLSSACTGIRIGYMGSAAIKNISFDNITIQRAQNAFDFICCGGPTQFGPETIQYTGAAIENIRFCHCHASNVFAGIRMNVRNTGNSACIRHVTFDDVQINSIYEGAIICSDVQGKIDDISFSDCKMTVSGNVTPIQAQSLSMPLSLFRGHTVFPYLFTCRNANLLLNEGLHLETSNTAEGWLGPISIE